MRRAAARCWSPCSSLLAVALSGCVSLPRRAGRSGRSRSTTQGEGETLVDYTPAGPERGSAPVPLVDNFLTAMTATPLNTSRGPAVPHRRESSRGWVPERGTVVYGSQQLVEGRRATGSRCGSRDVVELDARGAWLGDPTGGRGHDYRLRLVQEGGEWRIANPPDRLIIPRAHFDTPVPAVPPLLLRQVGPGAGPRAGLRAARPPGARPCWSPALLQGPEPELRGVERTFLPAGTRLDGISVPVSRDGTAEVPLGDEVLDLDDDQLNLLFAQLAWTLGQVAGRRADAGHRRRHARSTCPAARRRRRRRPSGPSSTRRVAWASTSLFGLRDGRVVTLDRRPARSGSAGRSAALSARAALDRASTCPAQHIAGVTRRRPPVARVRPGRGRRRRRRRCADVRTVYPAAPTCCGRPTTSTASCGSWTAPRPAPGSRWCGPGARADRRGARAHRAPGRPVRALAATAPGWWPRCAARRRDELLVARVRARRRRAGCSAWVPPARLGDRRAGADRIRGPRLAGPAAWPCSSAPDAGHLPGARGRDRRLLDPRTSDLDAELFARPGRPAGDLAGRPGAPLYVGTADGRFFSLSPAAAAGSRRRSSAGPAGARPSSADRPEPVHRRTRTAAPVHRVPRDGVPAAGTAGSVPQHRPDRLVRRRPRPGPRQRLRRAAAPGPGALRAPATALLPRRGRAGLADPDAAGAGAAVRRRRLRRRCSRRWSTHTRSTACSRWPARSAGCSPTWSHDLLADARRPRSRSVLLVPVPSRRRGGAAAGPRPAAAGDPARPPPGCAGTGWPPRVAAAAGARRPGARTRPASTPLERAANLAGSMRRARSAAAADRAAWCVVDDVLTTGSTAREAQRALEDGRRGGRRGSPCVAATRRRR